MAASASSPAARSRSRAWTAPCSPPGSPTSASSAGSSTCRSRRPPSCGTPYSLPGKDHGAVPVGIGVYGTTGRLEKGYRAFGFELDAERTIVEAGDAAAQGEGGGLRRPGGLPRPAREPNLPSVLCTLTVDDHTSASGVKRYMLGGEPILTRDGEHAHRRPRPPPLRHLGGVGAVAGQARAARLPPSGPGARSATSSRCPTWRSSTRSPSAPWTRPAAGPGQRADPVRWFRQLNRLNVLVCIKRVPDFSGEVLLAEDAQSADARFVGFTLSNHDSCAVELAVQVASATEGKATVLTVGDAGGCRAAPLGAGRRLHRRCPGRGRPRRPRAGRRRPRDRRGRPRPRSPRARRTTWCCWATTPPTPATSRWGSGSPTSWAARW